MKHKTRGVRLKNVVSCFMFHVSREQGMALLSAAVIVLLLLVAIGLSMLSSGIFEGSIAETQRAGQDALSAAQSGVKDALIKLARDKSFTSTSGYFLPAGCTLNGTTACAKVIVETSQSACSQAIGANQDCIVSRGTINNAKRKLEVILSVDPDSGKITTVSTKEL